MSKEQKYQTVHHEAIREFGMAVFAKLNVPDGDAKITIDRLVEADLRGMHSHGMQRLVWYSSRLSTGKMNCKPNIRVIKETPVMALVDGNSGLGQVISNRCMAIAIKKARTHGVATVSARNSHHFGACAFWAQMALPHNMVGIAITNGGAIMAPWGGLTPTTSNNPIGVAIPANKELPIVLDMAQSIVAGGKLDPLDGLCQALYEK